MRFAPSPTPEMPGEKWHRETFEESLKAKPKGKPAVIVSDDTKDDSGWASPDDSGFEN